MSIVPHPEFQRKGYSSGFIEFENKLLSIVEYGHQNYTWQDMYDANLIPPSVINDGNKNVKLTDIVPLFPNIKLFSILKRYFIWMR